MIKKMMSIFKKKKVDPFLGVEPQPYGLIAMDLLEDFKKTGELKSVDVIGEFKRMNLESHPYLTSYRGEFLELYKVKDQLGK